MAKGEKLTTKNCPSIKYTDGKDGYKYQLIEEWECTFILKSSSFSISKGVSRSLKFLEFRVVEDSEENSDDNSHYKLVVRHEYAWDGLSYFWDSSSSMRGSLVHDALYQLMRESVLSTTKDRPTADKILRDLCVQDGMWEFKAWLIYVGVRIFGERYASPSEAKKVYESPPPNQSSEFDREGNDEDW